MPWPHPGATLYHSKLGLPEKGRAIKRNMKQDWNGKHVLSRTCFTPYACHTMMIIFRDTNYKKRRNDIQMEYRLFRLILGILNNFTWHERIQQFNRNLYVTLFLPVFIFDVFMFLNSFIWGLQRCICVSLKSKIL